jgi:hypothetical protein
MTTPTTPTDIQSKILIVKPTIRKVGQSKTDEDLTEEVHGNHAMDSTAGAYVKKLWPKQFIAPFTKIAGEFRRFHKRNSVVSRFGDLVPTVRFEDYNQRALEYAERFNAAADDFCANYDAIIEEAKRIHNGAFRADFYPTKDSIRSEFSFTLLTSPVPRIDDIAVNYLCEERVEQIRQELSATVDEAAKAATQQVIARLLECVRNIASKLSDPEAIFRDSLIENLRSMLAIAPALNIADDPTVIQLMSECNEKLLRDPTVIRGSTFQREITANYANQIAASFGNVGGRKIAA